MRTHRRRENYDVRHEKLDFVGEFVTERLPHTAATMTVITYRDLDVWKQGMDLVEACYKLTATFPKSELYGLTSQLRRAAVSIPANVAEGHCRKTTKAYRHHVSLAMGSHGELETCLELGSRLGFLSQNDKGRVLKVCDAVGRLLSGLHRALVRKIGSTHPSP